MMWKSVKQNKMYQQSDNFPKDKWVEHYKSVFKPKNVVLEDKWWPELEKSLKFLMTKKLFCCVAYYLEAEGW